MAFERLIARNHMNYRRIQKSASLSRHFTLVELLVVIAIISILASLMMPMLSRALGSARSVACVSQLKQHYIGFLSYADENQGWLPKYYNGSKTWVEVFCLNGYSGVTYRQAWGYDGRNACGIWVCPEDARSLPGGSVNGGVSYAINNIITNTASGYKWYKMRQIKTVGQTSLIMDSWVADLSQGPYFIQPYTQLDRVSYRHMGKANVMRVDGVVKGYHEVEVPSSKDDPFWGYVQ
jgi:prepilin-type N-terminal cleavage/methylation domain-containing protein